MADIDTAAEIEVVSEGHLIVTIPLVGEVSKQWRSSGIGGTARETDAMPGGFNPRGVQSVTVMGSGGVRNRRRPGLSVPRRHPVAFSSSSSSR